jgi:hypothetical protein
MELATEDSRTSVREQLRRELCGEQKKMRQHPEKLRTHSHLQQEQLKRGQERLKLQLEQLLQERRGHSFDI